jgi:hypothetical protein
MKGNSFRLFLLFAVVMLSPNSRCLSADSDAANSPTEISENWHSPAFVLQALEREQAKDGRVFVVQSELDPLIRGGGGACASAAGIDLLQVLRRMSGESTVGNPHQAVLAAIKDQPALLDGRVTNDQFKRLIDYYDKHCLDLADVAVNVTAAPNGTDPTFDGRWAAADGPNLDVVEGQVKIISYTVTKTDGTWLGRHFVLLREHHDDQIIVLDPQRPYKDHKFIVRFEKGAGGAREHLFFDLPADVPARPLVQEVNTVFTITIAQEDEQRVPREITMPRWKTLRRRSHGLRVTCAARTTFSIHGRGARGRPALGCRDWICQSSMADRVGRRRRWWKSSVTRAGLI